MLGSGKGSKAYYTTDAMLVQGSGQVTSIGEKSQGRTASKQSPTVGMESEKQSSSFQALDKVPLFHFLSNQEKNAILERMTKRTYKAGEIVFEQGSIGEEFFIVVDGTAELTIEKAAARAVASLVERSDIESYSDFSAK